jgi:cytochrome P450
MAIFHESHLLDPFAPALIEDPYPTYARLLEAEPWEHQPSAYWVVSRYADVRTVLYDPRFSRADFRERARSMVGEGPLASMSELFLLFRDPPDHTRLRRLVGQAFTPLAVERMRQQIGTAVDDLLEPLLDSSTFDLIAELAYPLPVTVISALLGIPTNDREQFRGWSSALADGMEAMSRARPDALARGNGAVEEMTTYLSHLVAERRLEPRDDLLSDLIQARDGDDRLSEAELLATALLLFFAGHETTVNLIGNGLLALMRDASQLTLVRNDPRLVGNAVEELLRFDSPVQRSFRSTAEEVVLGGQRIPCGARVMALIGAANRDPRRFVDYDKLDVRRQDAKHHLSFGGGIHYCIGAPLVRLEAELTLTRVLQCLPRIAIDDVPVQWRANLIFRGLEHLQVVTGSAAHPRHVS